MAKSLLSRSMAIATTPSTTSSLTISAAEDVTSSISRIPPEILWAIFAFNAQMDPERDNEESALNSLRHLSQVCSLWRNIVLGSPSFWGRALNLAFVLRSQTWCTEILRRTGQAEMDVLATHPDVITLLSASEFTYRHWTQIRSLVVRTTPDPIPFNHYRIWSQISRRPSNLLHLTIHGSQDIIFDFLIAISQERFPLLRSLDVLESFSILNSGSTSRNFSFSHASLHSLRRIKMAPSLQVRGMLQFLLDITPAEDCLLDFVGSTFFGPSQASAIDAVSSVLPKYLVLASTRRKSSVRPVANVVFTNSSMEFSTSSLELEDDPSLFRFHLREAASEVSSAASLPAGTLHGFIQHLLPLPLHNIRQLSLDIAPPRFLDHAINSAIDDFTLKLTAVEDLQANYLTLIYLDNLQRQASSSGLILPALRNIQTDDEGLSILREFLGLRLDMGAAAEDPNTHRCY